MRIYSQLLSMAMDSHEDTLFTFDYSMPEEYRPIFEHKFLLRFGYRNIGFDSYQMFKRMLESKLIEVMPRYLKLYESENVPLNPFVNTRVKNNAFARNRGRTKNYATANSKDHRYSNNSGSNSTASETGAASGFNQNNISTNQSTNKQRGIRDSGNSKLNLFADTPQTQVQTQGKAGDGASASDGSDSNVSDKYFNDGYITTATRDRENSTEINSGSSDGYQVNGSETGQTAYEQGGSKSDTITQDRSVGGGQVYSDSEQVAANEGTQINDGFVEGISGVLLSDALVQWRKTFINIDEMLLDELDELFMGIY